MASKQIRLEKRLLDLIIPQMRPYETYSNAILRLLKSLPVSRETLIKKVVKK
jgi:hypothetical protein